MTQNQVSAVIVLLAVIACILVYAEVAGPPPLAAKQDVILRAIGIGGWLVFFFTLFG